tara:strand:- start:239 stop:742 length:504 start_codon:yes stop_codon:yes gene_type:complete
MRWSNTLAPLAIAAIFMTSSGVSAQGRSPVDEPNVWVDYSEQTACSFEVSNASSQTWNYEFRFADHPEVLIDAMILEPGWGAEWAYFDKLAQWYDGEKTIRVWVEAPVASSAGESGIGFDHTFYFEVDNYLECNLINFDQPLTFADESGRIRVTREHLRTADLTLVD